jgi:hypothetical protein
MRIRLFFYIFDYVKNGSSVASSSALSTTPLVRHNIFLPLQKTPSAFSGQGERMVVYQALYGDQAYWVRPEDMFFGKVTRDGRTFNRFTEIDK